MHERQLATINNRKVVLGYEILNSSAKNLLAFKFVFFRDLCMKRKSFTFGLKSLLAVV
jgi:hypothetical protein